MGGGGDDNKILWDTIRLCIRVKHASIQRAECAPTEQTKSNSTVLAMALYI